MQCLCISKGSARRFWRRLWLPEQQFFLLVIWESCRGCTSGHLCFANGHGSSRQWSVWEYFAGCQSNVKSFLNWKATFGRHETNKVAHRLARLGLTLDAQVSWFEEPPDVIFDLLLEDSITT
ncbi:hypothetical protein DVH24_019378 [Malus domestica]|uniref:RNase H type-1 domain-containing protein n=1 Tax=Malus domestica TaxID=3750 RepID=A0A498I085_MALDO|nr:hypothetical protein DVH24_019378 [Malus domestica]